MKRLVLTALALAMLGGCTKHSGPILVGKDTYMLTQSSPWGGLAKDMAADVVAEASEFCANQGKVIQLQGMKSGYDFGINRGQVFFMCVDPEVATPVEYQGNAQTLNINVK